MTAKKSPRQKHWQAHIEVRASLDNNRIAHFVEYGRRDNVLINVGGVQFPVMSVAFDDDGNCNREYQVGYKIDACGGVFVVDSEKKIVRFAYKKVTTILHIDMETREEVGRLQSFSQVYIDLANRQELLNIVLRQIVKLHNPLDNEIETDKQSIAAD